METEPLLSPNKPRTRTAFAEAAVDKDYNKAPSNSPRPASVNLEGSDWLLTTLLITLDAILLELYQSEKTQWATFVTWFYDYECHSGWVCHLLDMLFIMFAAVANVTLLVPVINVNVRTPRKRSWRGWLFMAWCSLCLVNTMTVLQVVDSIQNCFSGDDHVDSWTAHFWLISTAVLAAIGLNMRFVYLYGWFSIFTCNEDRTLKSKQGLMQVYYQDNVRKQRHVQAHEQMQQETQSLLNVVRAPQLRRFNTGTFLEHVSKGFTNLVGRRVKMVRTEAIGIRRCDEGSGDISNLFKVSYVHSWKRCLQAKLNRAYTEVAEIQDVFEYSSWIKSAAIFAVLMLIYNCIKTTEIFFSLASSWDDYHKMAVEFQDQLASTRGSLTELDRNLTELSATEYDEGAVTAAINETLPSVIQDVSALQSQIEGFEKATGSAYDVAGTVLDIALLTTAKLVNVTDLKGNEVVSAFFYIDSIIPILKYTCMIGYPIGTLIGLHSLYQVLVQHKRMSLGLEHALAIRTQSLYGKEELDEEDARQTLLGIDKKYQIGGAVYFFGILMSTAVVQQHIFGFFITFITAVVVDLKNFDVLLNIGGYLIFVYLAVMMTNLLLTHVIGDRLLTKEGFQIRHPWMFFLYLFIFSMIHAVLGFLYALWRAVLLLVTTFWVLNRLDVSLFLAGKQFDNGHYSFMSMLLLTRVIRLTNIAQGYVHPRGGQGPMSETSGELYSETEGGFRSQDLIIDEKEDDDNFGGPLESPPVHAPRSLREIEAELEQNQNPSNNPPLSAEGTDEDVTIDVDRAGDL